MRCGSYLVTCVRYCLKYLLMFHTWTATVQLYCDGRNCNSEYLFEFVFQVNWNFTLLVPFKGTSLIVQSAIY
jgi:hypothetical protein